MAKLTIHALDIGGTGVRYQGFEVGRHGDLEPMGAPRDLGVAPYERFEAWLSRHLGKVDPSDGIGVSCAGFVDAKRGVVSLSRVTGWRDHPLARRLSVAMGVQRVAILNDAEAHLKAHLYGVHKGPTMCLALGTSPGFAIADEDERIITPRRGTNFDIGQLTLPTRASDPHVWAALGKTEFDALVGARGPARGAEHFGCRLGHLLRNLCSLFQPRTVVLAGGIVAAWGPDIQRGVEAEFKAEWPDWLERPALVLTPYARHSALWGAARAAAR